MADITRIRSDALPPNEEVYRLLVNAVRDYAIFALDCGGVIRTWNEGARRLQGYVAHEVIGTHFSRFYTEEDIARNHPAWELEQAIQNGTYEEEGWRLKKDGTRFWVSVVITALRDDSGVLRGFGKVTRDLTIKKQAEDRLIESEERFRLLVTNVQDYAILTLDTEGFITTWNTGAERIKGYKASEILGKHFSVFYPREEADSGKPEMELRIAELEGRYEEEGWRIRKDGTLFWANVIVTALRDEQGTLKGFAKVTRDLTARRQTEEALRQSQERYKLLVDSVKDYAIIMLDPKGRVAAWNEGAKRLKGYDVKEILGHHFSRFYLPEDIEAGKPETELRVATQTGRFEDEGWRLRKDGSRFWANVVVTVIRDSTGAILGFSKVTRDLTEKKKSEDALKEAYEGLERRVEKRTAELARAKEQAEKALQARDEFFSIASHELRTPLTSLKLKSQMARRAYRGKADLSPEALKHLAYVQETDEQLDRLGRLIEDMLDLTRISQGKLAMEPESVDLCAVVDKTVERMAAQFRECSTPISFEGCASAPVWVDALRIEQVVLNLLSNALRYAPGGDVRVRVSSEGEMILVSVKDHGPGIAPENHEQIFNRYERLVPSENVSGLGIGLYLARSIVEAHGGRFYVQSKLGDGAQFIMELPREAKRKSGQHDPSN